MLAKEAIYEDEGVLSIRPKRAELRMLAICRFPVEFSGSQVAGRSGDSCMAIHLYTGIGCHESEAQGCCQRIKSVPESPE